MSHFDKETEFVETPSEEDLLVQVLKETFGFDYDENNEPIIQTTLDDNPDAKSLALENITELLELRKTAFPNEERVRLAEAIHKAIQPGAHPRDVAALKALLDYAPQIVSAVPPLLTGDLPQREWLIKDWLPANCVSMFTGEGGVGKSFATLQIACALISGVKDCYFNATSQPVSNTDLSSINAVYAAWEDELEEVSRRIRRIKGKLEWPDLEKIEGRFAFVDLKRLGPIWGPKIGEHLSSRGELLDSGKELLRICEEKGARLLVLDPGAGAFGSNENDRAAVREFTGYMSGWGVENRCATLIISHPPKSGETYSGSTDWLGSVRSLWNLGLRKAERKEDDGKTEIIRYHSLTHEKSNYSLRQPEKFLAKGRYGVWLEVDSIAEANVNNIGILDENDTEISRETVNFG